MVPEHMYQIGLLTFKPPHYYREIAPLFFVFLRGKGISLVAFLDGLSVVSIPTKPTWTILSVCLQPSII